MRNVLADADVPGRSAAKGHERARGAQALAVFAQRARLAGGPHGRYASRVYRAPEAGGESTRSGCDPGEERRDRWAGRCGDAGEEGEAGLHSGGAQFVRAGLGRIEKIPDHGCPFGDGKLADGTRQSGPSVRERLGRVGEARSASARSARVIRSKYGAAAAPSRGGPGAGPGGPGPGRRSRADPRQSRGGARAPGVEGPNVEDLAERRRCDETSVFCSVCLATSNWGAVDSEAGGTGAGDRSGLRAGPASDPARAISSKRSAVARGLESSPAVRMWSQSLAAWKRR